MRTDTTKPAAPQTIVRKTSVPIKRETSVPINGGLGGVSLSRPQSK